MIHREKIDSIEEKEIVYNLIFSEKFCKEICPIIDCTLFDVDYIRLLVSYIKSYYDEYKINPDNNIIKIFRSHLDEINDENLKENILIFIKKLDESFDKLSFNADYAIQKAIKYLKKQSIKNLSLDLDSYITTGDINKAENRITKYKTIEKNSGEAVSILNNPELIRNAYTDEESTLFDIKGAYGKVIGKIHREDFISFLAPMKRGKCLAKGTEILMYDGSKKEVQDLKVGDKLMGDDSTVRNVLSTSTGYGDMYEVKSLSVESDGNNEIKFRCNADHILVLKNKNGKIVEMSVLNYLKLSKKRKKTFYLYREKVEFKERTHVLHPYFVGAYLGNHNIIKSFNLDQKTLDKLDVELKKLDIKYDSHIPEEYMLDSSRKRFQFLAGLIDSKGEMSKNKDSFHIFSQNESLLNDIKIFCTQLGFRTNIVKVRDGGRMKNGKIIYIKGNLSDIPVRIKKHDGLINTSHNCFRFAVKQIEPDNYYGFVIDGNHRFLLGDGTVSHNTFALIDVSCRALYYGLKVLFVSLEMSENDVSKRFYTALTKDIKDEQDVEFPYFELNGDKYELKHRIIHKKQLQIDKIQKRLDTLKRIFRGGDIKILSVPSYSLSPSQLDDKIDKLIQQEQFIPDVITIDYADIMAVQSNNEYRHQIDDIWKRLRGLAQKRKAVVFTASQSTRASLSRDVESEDLAEDIRKLAHVTSMVAINQTNDEKKNGIVRFKQLALREGESEYRQAVCTQCLSLGSMVIDSCFDDEINLNNNNQIQRKNTKN